MTNKRFFRTFAIIAPIALSFTFWGHRLFQWMDYPTPYSLRPKLMLGAVIIVVLLALAHLAVQIMLHKRNGFSFIVKILGFNIMALCALAFYSLIVSMIAEKSWGQIPAMLSKSPGLSIEDLIRIFTMSGEGPEMIFLFFLALLSGYMFYSRKDKFKFSKGEFKAAWVTWLCIIFINEMVIQPILPGRTGNIIWDFLNNMLAVSIGLVLSMRWFWTNRAKDGAIPK